MLKKPFLCLLFVAGATFSFAISIPDVKLYPTDEVTSLPQTESELQQQSSEPFLQAASEPVKQEESKPVIMKQAEERRKLAGISEPIISEPIQFRHTKIQTMQSSAVKQQEAKLQEQEEFVPKKMVIMPIPDNATWMKSNNQEKNYLILDKRDVRYYPVKTK